MYPMPPGDGPLDLLVWDAPNIDATLAQVIGAKPTAASRPRYDAIARWLVQLGGEHEVEGAVFANVPPVNAGQMRGWVEAVRSLGFAVFARPKLADRDDVDLDMLEHVHHRARSGRLARLVVASGDGRNFLAPLEALAQDGVEVTVLSFFEVAGYAAQSPAPALPRPGGGPRRVPAPAGPDPPGLPAPGRRLAAADPLAARGGLERLTDPARGGWGAPGRPVPWAGACNDLVPSCGDHQPRLRPQRRRLRGARRPAPGRGLDAGGGPVRGRRRRGQHLRVRRAGQAGLGGHPAGGRAHSRTAATTAPAAPGRSSPSAAWPSATAPSWPARCPRPTPCSASTPTRT